MLSKNVNNKKCAPKFVFSNEKNPEIFGWFLTYKIDFECQILALFDGSNSPNLVISFEYGWFLVRKLSNFVSPLWKLHNWHCNNLYCKLILNIKIGRGVSSLMLQIFWGLKKVKITLSNYLKNGDKIWTCVFLLK